MADAACVQKMVSKIVKDQDLSRYILSKSSTTAGTGGTQGKSGERPPCPPVSSVVIFCSGAAPGAAPVDTPRSTD